MCELPDIELYNLMKESTILVMATDGGAIVFKGFLGFVLTNTKGNVLLTCYGQPAGHNVLSFQSKTCAFIAAI